MNYLLDEDDIPAHAEREFTLSTGSILGIFFGLVLLCGLFFGFGYSVGSHKSTPPAQASTGTPVTTDFNAFKPAAGLPAGTTGSVPAPAHPAGTLSPPAVTSTTAVTGAKPPGSPASPAATPAPIVRVAPPATAHITPIPSAPVGAAPGTAPAGTFLVQVAAVSHQQDSALLMNALRIKGYAPSAFLEADKLIHVQLGPYNSRHDADLMRQRLVTDGYSPIIK